MGQDDDHEPVFVRSKWGTNNYEYNPGNPIGIILIVVTLAVVAGGILHLQDRASVDENELREAVYAAAETLEQEPHIDPSFSDYSGLVKEALDDAVAEADSTVGPAVEAIGDADDYEVTGGYSGDDTDAAYCMHLSQTVSSDDSIPVPPQGAGAPIPMYDLSVTVSEGRC